MDRTPVFSALVTGASRGIGLGIATRLARQGYALTITARDPERLSDTAATLREAGAPDVVAAAADMADPAAPAQLCAIHGERFGSIDTLILNAGVGTAGAIGSLPMRRVNKTVDVNFRAPFSLIQNALPLLRAAAGTRQKAKVITVASITGVYAEAGLAVYGATKAALLSLVETLNAEESANGINATAIAPAYVDTDMSAWIHDRIPAESMIDVNDIVELVDALIKLSPSAVVNKIVVSRSGTNGYCA
ncbi:SDR family NAD(P)-dependent oxidoreductase [Nocardia sp. NPDC057663]|uniref:SDR family NAD(P)-dependent oxidoreductase n=1 Tax=Nocardia sp. NPDC057663 TaxID=3346201 RepID=UPI00366D75D1